MKFSPRFFAFCGKNVWRSQKIPSYEYRKPFSEVSNYLFKWGSIVGIAGRGDYFGKRGGKNFYMDSSSRRAAGFRVRRPVRSGLRLPKIGYTLGRTRVRTGILAREGIMDKFLSETWNPLLELFGSILRPIGGLLFGAVIGWITANTFLGEDKDWQVKIAVILGVLGTFIALHLYSGSGTTALFGMGIGIAGIIYLIRQMQPAKKPK
jgi:hypothetical protein